jgi:hypothetical protein
VTDVRFARSDDIDIAYRVVGDGPIDLVYVEGAYTLLEIAWELSAYRRYRRARSPIKIMSLTCHSVPGQHDRSHRATRRHKIQCLQGCDDLTRHEPTRNLTHHPRWQCGGQGFEAPQPHHETPCVARVLEFY